MHWLQGHALANIFCGEGQTEGVRGRKALEFWRLTQRSRHVDHDE